MSKRTQARRRRKDGGVERKQEPQFGCGEKEIPVLDDFYISFNRIGGTESAVPFKGRCLGPTSTAGFSRWHLRAQTPVQLGARPCGTRDSAPVLVRAQSTSTRRPRLCPSSRLQGCQVGSPIPQKKISRGWLLVH